MDVWILGASGRCGREVAHSLVKKDIHVVLVGRNRGELETLRDALGGETKARVVVADGIDAMSKELSKVEDQIVVYNTIGPFTETALPIIQACKKAHYLDISNEITSTKTVLDMNNEAVVNGRCLVTGAAWGVLGCESVTLKVCEGMPPASHVRVDSFPFVNTSSKGPEKLGRTLANTIAHGLPFGGRMYLDGNLVKVNVGSEYEPVTLPDGSVISTGSVPFGDLEAARRAAGNAPSAVACSAMVPGSAVVRAILPFVSLIFRSKFMRDFAAARMANIEVPPIQEIKPSWARALVKWSDGTVKEAWLKAGEGMKFTTDVAGEVAYRLATGKGKPGAFTPGALFGSELAVTVGGEFLL